MFEGKGLEVDRDERAIEAAVASFREQIEDFAYPGPPAHPRRRAAAARAREIGAGLLAGSVAVALVGICGAAARLGWNFVGG